MKKRIEFKNLLKEKRITGDKLAKILGYSNGAIYAWVGGKSEPNTTTILTLSEILGVSVEKIVRIFGEN